LESQNSGIQFQFYFWSVATHPQEELIGSIGQN
jgi:hypothetical protein